MLVSVIAGLLSGVISGMGIGGGAVLIPALTFFLKIEQHTAQCTNLYYFIPTAIAALAIHIKNKNIEFKTAVPITVFGIIGAVLGSFIAVNMPTKLLRRIFAVFLFLMGISQILTKKSDS